MPNQSEIEELLIAGAFSDGVKIGNKVRQELMEGILSGNIKMPSDQPLNVEVEITDLIKYQLPMKDKILAKIGSPYVMALGNTGLAVGGGAIVLRSGGNFLQTTNKTARIFYGLSMMCSGTGTISSVLAVYCNKCGLSKTGMLGDGFGGLFLKAGDYMNNIGERVERKPKSFGLSRFLPKSQVRRPLPKMGTGYKGMSFVANSGNLQQVLSNIPYTKIIMIGGTVLTIYRSSKLLIRASRSIYRYMEKKCTPK